MLRGKRIVIVLGVLAMAGAERQALLLARMLRRNYGAEPELWGVWGDYPSTLGYQHVIPQRVHNVILQRSLPARLISLSKLAAALRRAQPDVLMPFTLPPNVLCGLVWRFTGARTCIWNQRDEGFGRTPTVSERLAVRLTPWFATNSTGGAAFLENVLGASASRVRVIDNGVEVRPPRLTRLEWRRQHGIDETCFLACMIGNFQRAKDHATLLRAWRIVTDRLAGTRTNAQLLLAGGSGDLSAASIEALAGELGLGQSVRFLGHLKDVSSLLHAVDLGVFSSRSEGSPNGVLECMATGLPVVGSDIPGVAHILGPLAREQVVPPGDEQAMAARILDLIDDGPTRATLGAQNRSRVAEAFAPERMCEEYVRLIETAIGG